MAVVKRTCTMWGWSPMRSISLAAPSGSCGATNMEDLKRPSGLCSVSQKSIVQSL